MPRCWLFHQWGKWSKPFVGEVKTFFTAWEKAMLQQRACEHCGKVQIREAR